MSGSITVKEFLNNLRYQQIFKMDSALQFASYVKTLDYRFTETYTTFS